MKLAFYYLLFMGLLAKLPACAQATGLALATDTVGYPGSGGCIRYYLGTLTKVDGTEVSAYLPATRVGYGGGKLI